MASNPVKLKMLPRSTMKAKVATRLVGQVAAGNGILVTKAAGNFTVAIDVNGGVVQPYDADLAALAANSTNGFWAHTGPGTGSALTLTGTANEITVTHGSGDGTPVFSLPTALTFTGKTITGGTFGTLTVNPTALSTNKGIAITQTSPTSGSVVGPLSFNTVAVNNQINVTDSGVLDPLKSYVARALEVNLTEGGSNAKGFQEALYVRLNHTVGASDIGLADHVALSTAAYSNKDAGASLFAGGLYGADLVTWAASGAVHSQVVATEVEAHVMTGAVVGKKIGLRINNNSDIHSTGLDLAIAIKAAGADGGWHKLIAFGEESNAQSLATTGDFFYSYQAMTVANIFNLSNVTVTGNIMNFPNYTVSGAGAIAGASATFGGAAFSTEKLSITGSVQTAVARASQSDGASSTTGFSGFDARTDILQVNLLSFGSANTLSAFGLTLGGWARLQANDINAGGHNGLIIGEVQNKPIVFGTNNTERMRLLAGLAVGLSTDPGAGIISALTGFRINNAATSGNVLRGNGTNFISAQLATTDLSGLGTGVATALAVNVGTAGAFITFNGALGTPSSGTLTNATGLPVSTGINGLGTGIATALAVNVGTDGAPVIKAGALGSPSSVGTLPAHTLGGTISGGGNQINNVIIGTSTPLAGFFTTLSASTSLTSPLFIGGTGTTGTQLTFQTTTGVGTTDAFAWNGGNNGATQFGLLTSLGFGVGMTPTRGAFSATINSTSINGTYLKNSNSDSVASWQAVNDGDLLAEFGMRSSARASVGTLTANDGYFFTNSTSALTLMANNAAAVIRFACGGTALKMQLSAAGGLSVGTSTDPGAGAISGTASLKAHVGTAIPAGGTAGAGLLVSSTSNFGVFFGSGAPTLSAAKGSLYLRSDGSTTNDRMYVNTNGSTTWTAVTTAA